MGIKIDLPIHTIEEANILQETLHLRARALRAAAPMIHTTEEERTECLHKAGILEMLVTRLMKAD